MTFDIDSAITSNQPTGRQAPEPVRQRTEPFRRAGGAALVDTWDPKDDDLAPGQNAPGMLFANPDDPKESYSDLDEYLHTVVHDGSAPMPFSSDMTEAVTTAEAAKPEEERMMDDIAAEASAAKVLRKKLGASSMNLPEVMNQGKVADIISSIHGLEPNDITKLAPLTQLYADAVARRMDAGMSFQDAFQDALGGHAYPYDIA